MTQTVTHSLAAKYYTDPEVFRIEQDGLLARTWQFAGHSSKLENIGDYFAFEMAGESLFCIKGRDEVIRTFYNVCQHRAHQLVSGTGTTRVVVCPYHAWTYELTGGLRAGRACLLPCDSFSSDSRHSRWPTPVWCFGRIFIQ